ncbi:hypothetical protein IV203_001553 [Nitzschia inconspicua]|uniref:Uncharacterized protein n=1 Tax=Nitzschia inconspicua TaxID=303405 RepID=A0A9K3L9L4_9STRA|nr:hypothetical protein IV203_001553 [Nitzschia inconspicua]
MDSSDAETPCVTRGADPVVAAVRQEVHGPPLGDTLPDDLETVALSAAKEESTTKLVAETAPEPSDYTTALTNDSAKEKKSSKKQPQKIGTPMPPHYHQIKEELVQQVEFFRDHTTLKDLDRLYYTTIPDSVDWGSSNSILEAFPTIKGRGKLVIPMALIFESDQVEGKLVIINYWRLLKADEQRKVRETVRTYYLRPSQGNERINLNVGTRTVANDTAAAIVEPPKTKITAVAPDGVSGIPIEDDVSFGNAVRDLSCRVRYFEEVAPLDGLTRIHYFGSIPSEVDWNNSASVNKVFPPLLIHSTRDVPLCLLLEAETDEERLVVVNWWRYLDSIQQPKAFQELRRYYRAPAKSKDYMRELQDVHDKRKERQNAPTWGFRGIETCQQLAEKLKLSCDMIQTANIEPGVICKTEGCIYPALCGNGGFCCRHRLSFAPLAGKERRKRGHYLLGPVYTKPNVRLCSCHNEVCVGIGFSDTMVRFDVTRLPEDLQSDIWDGVMPISRKTACLAPWHFHPQHRVFQPDGSWILTQYRRSTVFKDPETGKEWYGLPPPTYSLKNFLEEPEMVEYKARKDTSLLPNWVREYQKLEEGPVSIPEQQTRLLYEKIAHLEEKLNNQAMDFEASYVALEKEMAALQSKYNDFKHNKRNEGKRGKRKRTEVDEADTKNGTINHDQQEERFHGNRNRTRNEIDSTVRMNQGEMPSANSNPEQSDTAGGGLLEYVQLEGYPQYYQERTRDSGAWHGIGFRRYY